MLLPVLEALKAARPSLVLGLVTAAPFVELAELEPALDFVSSEPPGDSEWDYFADLDAFTLLPEVAAIAETIHKQDLFASFFGLEGARLPARLPRLRLELLPELARRFALPSEPFLVCAFEATHKFRTLPDTLAKHLTASALAVGVPVVLCGRDTRPELPATLDLRGRTSLLELAAVLAQARLVVGADSGVVHLAGTLGTPFVAIFAGVDPELRLRYYADWIALQADLPCVPCNKHEERCDFRIDCLRKLPPEAVWRFIRKQWEAPAARGCLKVPIT